MNESNDETHFFDSYQSQGNKDNILSESDSENLGSTVLNPLNITIRRKKAIESTNPISSLSESHLTDVLEPIVSIFKRIQN